ncbi:serine hydrolase domain-containing protein [Nocardia sp. NPDC059239]
MIVLSVVVGLPVGAALLLVADRGAAIGFIVDRSAGGPVTAAALQVSDRHGTQIWHAGEMVTPRTHFRIGSVTKTFVATVVLQLADQGILDAPRQRSRPQPTCPGNPDLPGRTNHHRYPKGMTQPSITGGQFPVSPGTSDEISSRWTSVLVQALISQVRKNDSVLSGG